MIQLSELALRYRVQKGHSIDQWLDSSDLKTISSVTDEYYDAAGSPFYEKGIFIRLRNDTTLEIKFNPNHLRDFETIHPLQYREYRFPINRRMFNPHQLEEFKGLEPLIGIKCPRPFSLAHFLGSNQLRSFVTLSKTRKTYATSITPRIRIDVDTFDELGTFVKFEGQIITTPYPTDDFLEDAQKLIKDLPLVPFDANYVDLALRETDEAFYKQGRYFVRTISYKS